MEVLHWHMLWKYTPLNSVAAEKTFTNYGDIFVVGSVDAVNAIAPYPEKALKENANYIIELAEAEGMRAHALAVKVRYYPKSMKFNI